MDEPLGPHEKHFRATLGRLVACRWLRPDAEMETLSPAAVDWLNDRIDELRAALGPFVKPPETIAPITLVTERSAAGAFARAGPPPGTTTFSGRHSKKPWRTPIFARRSVRS